MKILKIFGAVVGIHLVAFVLIFANPGCTSSRKQPSRPETAGASEPSPSITVPQTSPGPDPSAPMLAAAPAAGANTSFDAPSSMSASRYSPTRPNTAAANAVQAQPVADVTPATTYTVVSGDSLSLIAKKNHVTTKDLLKANNLTTNSKIKPGQKLLVPGKVKTAATSTAASTNSATAAAKPAETMPAPASDSAAKAKGNSMTHTVKNGETLGSIARKYQVKQGEIAVANNISNPAMIKVGMTLVIPGWQAPKSSKSSTPAAMPSPQESQPAPLAAPDAGASTPAATSPQVPVIKIDEPAPATPSNP